MNQRRDLHGRFMKVKPFDPIKFSELCDKINEPIIEVNIYECPNCHIQMEHIHKEII
jgi:hypothetical protein